jgi:hypothetical protein
MAKESIILELNAETDWDGATLTTLNRDDAIVTGQRYYKFNIAGPHGLLAADLGGLFSPVSAKLVGIAYSSWNPESKGRVVASDATGSFRQEITLKPAIQYVVVYPGDRLAFLTRDGGRGQIVLSVNEMSEQDAARWGMRHEPYVMPTRFRIIRQTGVAFAPNLGTLWQPDFTYDPDTGILTATESGTGVIPATSLCLYPRWQGCYVSIRYAGSNADGQLHMVDNLTRKAWVADTAMLDVKWSKVQFVSHDDGIALDATPAVVGQILVCDLEVALVHPGNRLCGRYQGGL